MSRCTDDSMGRLLHDYELGHLKEDEKRAFELHLYECNHCAAQVRDFTEAARILRNDPEARAVVADAARVSKTTGKFYIRLLMAAVLILVVAVPIYKFGIVDNTGEINQTLELRPSRSGGADVIYLDRGGSAEIRFYVNDSFGDSVDVLLTQFEGDTVNHIPDYSDFTDEGFGTLVLPLSDLREGHYVLTVSPISRTATVHNLQYMFRVK